MKIWYKFFAVIVAMALVTGCSKDDLGDDDITPGGSKDVAYMSVSVALPAGQRHAQYYRCGRRQQQRYGNRSGQGKQRAQDTVGARQCG